MSFPWEMIFGGVTGLIGTIWSSYNQRKVRELEIEDKKAQRSHELRMVEAETSAMIAETEARIRVTETQVQGAVELQEAAAFEASQRMGNRKDFAESFMQRLFAAEGWARYLSVPAGILLCVLFGASDFFKGVFRPAATAYLLGVSTWITWTAWDLLSAAGSALPPTRASLLVYDAMGTVMFLTTMAVSWWFGDRMHAKGMRRQGGAGR